VQVDGATAGAGGWLQEWLCYGGGVVADVAEGLVFSSSGSSCNSHLEIKGLEDIIV